MTLPQDSETLWSELAALIHGLPEAERRRILEAFRTFAHDLRQHLGQIHSAQELLSRLLGANDTPDDVLEMLEIIQIASGQARLQLRQFAATWIEGLADKEKQED